MPPRVGPLRRAAAPVFSACASEGPYSSFSSQWSPFFSATCLTDAHAVRWARSSESYCSSAASSVFAYVRWTLRGERFRVLGRSSSRSIGAMLWRYPRACVRSRRVDRHVDGQRGGPGERFGAQAAAGRRVKVLAQAGGVDQLQRALAQGTCPVVAP